MGRFSDRFPGSKTIIGMIHLPMLPGYVESRGIDHAVRSAIGDLHALEEGGIRAVLVENEYDRPHRVRAEPETVAAMTRVTRAVVQESESGLVGCEILLHDPRASLAVASIAGAGFIRTDYFVDRMTRPGYGEFEIDPEGLLEYRTSLAADDVLILADIQVKYATMIAPRPLADSAVLAREKGADAVIVTGDRSGHPPTIAQLQMARQGLPVLVGSGLNAANARTLLAECDGAIVGTSLMTDGVVDQDAVKLLISSIGNA
jgi:uncharacterized protein